MYLSPDLDFIREDSLGLWASPTPSRARTYGKSRPQP